MNTKNNKRRRESMDRIGGAFFQALRTKPLSRITVSELCQAAGLNRSTFYANFSDVYALADFVREKLEAEVRDLYQREHREAFNSNDYLRLFRHIRDNRELYEMYFKLGYDQDHPVLVYDVPRAQRDFGDRHTAYHIEFFKSGFNAIVKLWLAGGCRETPEEMNAILEAEYRGRQ